MRKMLLFFTLVLAFVTTLLASGACKDRIAAPPVAGRDDLTVVIGSVNAAGDTTIYLQTIVRPH
jgi:hypothetical protein